MSKRVVASLLLVVLLWGYGGCATQTPPDYLAFLERAFAAEIRGERNGTAFSAKISATPSADGVTVRVEYLTPDTLSGIVVTSTCNADGGLAGDAEVSRGKTTVRLDSESLFGLLEPVRCWFLLDTHTAVQKDDGGYVLQFADGVTAVMDETGLPSSYSAPSIWYDVIWWEEKF